MRPEENAILPDPMTPPDCDLRGLPYMPLDTVALLESDLFALSNGDELKAALTLWCRSWSQVPAGSLPDNDRILASLSQTGPAWPTVREIALHGWVKCSDGRLYHPVLAPKAIKAWQGRCAQRKRAEARWAKERGETPASCRGISRGNASESVSSNNQSKDWPAAAPQAGGFALAVEDDRVAGSAGHEATPEPMSMPPAGTARSVFAHLPRVVALTGRPERACRGLLGSWRKKLGDDVGVLDGLLTECERQDVAEPVAWMERAISRTTGQPVAEKHKTASERMVDEALGKARRAWSHLFEECRDFGKINRIWPEKAASLGLPGCALTREAYAAHFAGGAAR
ncbi:DUF1376 domain-containing protein [Parasaccharibacter apium]|uniref:DUF1376 domain-containing protein n=1 Tax=Parasaccharibacter apium TaxID=1510841 RepID=UPI0009D9F512|nr:DUF1376 domain-containing protein [Parasaccharibacter apium]